MTTARKIEHLWEQMQKQITRAYKIAASTNSDEGICLRDYAENQSMVDALAALLGRETANERQHRRFTTQPKGFSCRTAAMLILMRNVNDGSLLIEMPKATQFITLRQTAAEGMLIGYLARHTLSCEWGEAVRQFNYAKLMAA